MNNQRMIAIVGILESVLWLLLKLIPSEDNANVHLNLTVHHTVGQGKETWLEELAQDEPLHITEHNDNVSWFNATKGLEKHSKVQVNVYVPFGRDHRERYEDKVTEVIK